MSLDAFLDAVRPAPEATHVVAYSHTGYTTNLLADVTGGRAWIVWEYGDGPLPAEHGGPARLIVPHLYFWKSAKWIAGLRLLDHDEPGFWEQNGYHHRGNPGKSSATPVTETAMSVTDSTPSAGYTPPTRFAVPGRITVSNRAAATWQRATLTEVRRETLHAATFRFAVPDWEGHLPGQHLMLRLRAGTAMSPCGTTRSPRLPTTPGTSSSPSTTSTAVRCPAGSTRSPSPATRWRCAARSAVSSPGRATGPLCSSARAPASYR